MINRTIGQRRPRVKKAATPSHPVLRSWLLAREADKMAPKSLLVYRSAVQSLDEFLTSGRTDDDGEPLPPVGLMQARKSDIREWVVALRERPRGRRETGLAESTVRVWFSAVRQFYKWVIEEGDEGLVRNPTENISVPKITDDISTPTLNDDECRALLSVPGTSFLARRDAAIFYIMLDGGLRREEAQSLTVDDIDIETGAVFVEGKKTNRQERHRTVQLGIKARQAVDRYLRARSKRPYADQRQALWLSSWGSGALSHSAFQDLFRRHSQRIGVDVHPHMLRHTWASQFRKAGGSEGDLLVLGGWSNRAMLDRYGKADAAERARDAYRKISITDRIR